MPGNFLLTLKGANAGAVTGKIIRKEGELDYSTGMMCHGFEHKVVAQINPANGAAVGRRVWDAIRIRKEVDAASPKLINMLVTADKVTDAWLKFQRADGKGKQVVFYTIELTGGFVSSYRTYYANDATGRTQLDQNEQEEIELTFSNITETYVDGGITMTDSWAGDK